MAIARSFWPFWHKKVRKNNANSSRLAVKGLTLTFLGLCACVMGTSARSLVGKSAQGHPFEVLLPKGVSPGKNSRTNIFSTDDGKGEQATVYMTAKNPQLLTLPGFENVLQGFNILTGKQTVPLVQFNLKEKFENDGTAMNNLAKEDFFNDMITQPGTMDAMDCHYFDSYNLPKEIEVSCVSEGDASDVSKLYKSEKEYSADSSFSFGISGSGGPLGPFGGAFSLSRSRSSSKKQFAETDMMLSKKTLRLYGLEMRGEFLMEYCSKEQAGGAKGTSSADSTCIKEVEYLTLNQDFKSALKNDLSSLYATSLVDALDGYLMAAKMAYWDPPPKEMVWCTPVLIGRLPKDEQEMDPVKSRRFRSPTVLIGQNQKRDAKAERQENNERFPIFPIDAREVLRCLDRKVFEREGFTSIMDEWHNPKQGGLQSHHEKPLSDYGISLSTLGVFLPLFDQEKPKEDIESKMAAGVRYYRDATVATRKFLWTYGTHYVKDVVMGGEEETKLFLEKTGHVTEKSAKLATETKIATAEPDDQVTQDETDAITRGISAALNKNEANKILTTKLLSGLAAGVASPAKIGLEVKTSSESGEKAEASSSTRGFEMRFEGGSPSHAMARTKTSEQDWLLTVLANPVVVERTLMPISNLVRPSKRASCRRRCGQALTKNSCSCSVVCITNEALSCCHDFRSECREEAAKDRSLAPQKEFLNIPWSAFKGSDGYFPKADKPTGFIQETEAIGGALALGRKEDKHENDYADHTGHALGDGGGDFRFRGTTPEETLPATEPATAAATGLDKRAQMKRSQTVPIPELPKLELEDVIEDDFKPAATSLTGDIEFLARAADAEGSNVKPDTPYAGKRAFIELQVNQMFKLAKYVTAQTTYLNFWKTKAENAPAIERSRICKKYSLETNNYRQLWTLLTAQTSVDSNNNMPMVDCFGMDEEKSVAEVSSAQKLNDLKERIAQAKQAKDVRIANAFKMHAVMAEKRACFLYARKFTLAAGKNGVKRCGTWDPQFPKNRPTHIYEHSERTPEGKVNLLEKTMPLNFDKDSYEFTQFVSNFPEEMTEVFYGDDGLLNSPLYGTEAKQLKFQCHSQATSTSSTCCPSRCTNCENIEMNYGKRDAGFTLEMQSIVGDQCENAAGEKLGIGII